jgi:Protein of unknown function (DUF3617)
MRAYRAASIAIAVGIVLASALPAGAVEGPKPGMWKVITRVEENGGPIKETTQTNCVTAADFKDPGKAIQPEQSTPDEPCNRTGYRWDGRRLHFRIECTGNATSSSVGDIYYDTRTHFTGTITTKAQMGDRKFDGHVTLTGERTGDCTK